MIRLNIFLILIFLFFGIQGCTSHPAIQPNLPEPGTTDMGFSFSVENIVPVIWWRRGINESTDIGLRVGIPLSGTGIDINRVLFRKERSWEVLNLAYSINPNSNYDLSYIRFKKNLRSSKISWLGFRVMVIPKGAVRRINDGNLNYSASNRAGLFYGRQMSQKWGIEFGYFHDYNSMPLGKVFSTDWDPNSESVKAEYGDQYKFYPLSSGGNLPSEYSRRVGLSLQLYMYLGKLNK